MEYFPEGKISKVMLETESDDEEQNIASETDKAIQLLLYRSAYITLVRATRLWNRVPIEKSFVIS